MTLSLACAALLVLWLPGARAPGDGCKRCDRTGVLACSLHEGELLAFEREVLFCSRAAACPACAGGLAVDCPGCDGGPGVALAEARRAEAARFAASDSLAAHLGRAVPRIETARFQIVADLEAMREGKKRVDPHVVAHRLARDVEAVAALVARHYAPGADDYRDRMRMWIWKDPAAHAEVMRKFLFSSSTGDFKMLGAAPVFSVWTESPHFDEVPEVRSLFVHNAAHMLLSNLYEPTWIGDVGGGWFDAGAAHWYEYELMGSTPNHCIQEAFETLDYHGGRWRSAVRNRLDKEEQPLLPAVFPKATGYLTLEEQALCWSFYDWIQAEHAPTLAPLLRALKQRVETAELLRRHLGGGPLEVEQAWRAWVRARYSKKGDKLLEG